MPLLPYEKFEMTSSMSPGEVLVTLADSTEPRKWMRLFGGGRCPFEGEVFGNAFEIRRIIGYRNSFLPQISGTVGPGPSGGSQIVVGMTLHPFVLVFMCVWFGGVIVANLAVVMSLLTGKPAMHGSGWAALGPLAMLLFGWILVSGSFSLESRKATELLCLLLRASKTGA